MEHIKGWIWVCSPVMWIICNYMIDASMRWSHVFCCQLTIGFERLFARIVKIESTVSNYEIILIMLVHFSRNCMPPIIFRPVIMRTNLSNKILYDSSPNTIGLAWGTKNLSSKYLTCIHMILLLDHAQRWFPNWGLGWMLDFLTLGGYMCSS